MADPPMRARLAAIIQAGVINQHSFMDMAGEVLAELEHPTEGMIAEENLVAAVWSGMDKELIRRGLRANFIAAIRAARDGK